MTDRLVDILIRENAALIAMDLPRAASLLPEQTAALADLAACGDPAALHRLEPLVAENRRLLERAMTAQERVIGIVAQALSGPVSAYGATGRMTRPSGPVAISTRA